MAHRRNCLWAWTLAKKPCKFCIGRPCLGGKNRRKTIVIRQNGAYRTCRFAFQNVPFRILKRAVSNGHVLEKQAAHLAKSHAANRPTISISLVFEVLKPGDGRRESRSPDKCFSGGRRKGKGVRTIALQVKGDGSTPTRRRKAGKETAHFPHYLSWRARRGILNPPFLILHFPPPQRALNNVNCSTVTKVSPKFAP